MKVLFVSHTGALSSGGEISNYHLMKYLKANDYEVYIIFPNWENSTYKNALKNAGIAFYTQPYAWWGEEKEDTNILPENMKLVSEICKIIKDFDPDIIVTNTTVVPWGALAAAFMNKPHVWVAREFAVGEFAYLDKKMDFIKSYSNVVMANSKQLSAFISKKYNFPVKYFYSFVGTKGIKLGDNIPEVRLVSPNQIIDRKNQIELIKALAILKKRDKDFNTKAILIGDKDESYWQKIESLIKQENIENLVETHSFTDKPWLLVSKNDILVQTSLSESIGRTTTEAMKLGVPVIASDIPGHIEAFELGGGVLYRARNPKDLADKIEYALANQKQLQRNALKTKQKVLKTMSEKACNEPFLEVLKSIKGQENPQKELRHIAPYFNKYVKGRENLVQLQDQKLRENDKHLVQQNQLLIKQEHDIATLVNSKAYRLGRFQVRIVKKILLPLKSLRSHK